MSDYPMRINKYLAQKGYSTRRDADKLVSAKKVLINGKVALLGSKVNEDDKVEVRSLIKNQKNSYKYFAFYKPRGVITHSPQTGEKEIKNIISDKKLFPIGRLDKDSEGLIILTNDGRITDRLLNPKYGHTKEYIVETKEKLKNNFKEKIEKGIDIEGYKTKPSTVKILNPNTFSIILTEGKKHQIRRMVVATFNEVKNLKRIKVMNISLGNLKPGESREITGEELQNFLKSLGI